MAPRQKRKTPVGEGTSRDSSSNPSYQIIAARYLDLVFFSSYCFDIIQILRHYQLDKLVYTTHPINLDLLSEFYANLKKVGDGPLYRTRVAKRDIDFSPTILQDFLGCRPSDDTFIFYPVFDAPPPPFEHITLERMHEHFFGQQRPRNQSTLFSVTMLSITDNVLYKVIVGCILPIVTRGQALVRPHHLFLMYAFRHLLDINIALNVFHCIVHFTVPVQGKVHMPFGHILTAFLASLGINTSRGTIKPISEQFDRISLRNFALAGMKRGYGCLEWSDEHQEEPEEDSEEEPVEPVLSLSDQFARLESSFDDLHETVDTRLEEFGMRFDRYEQRQTEIHDMLSTLLQRLPSPSTAPPPPPSAD